MTKEIKATAPTPQDWIELVRENERLAKRLERKTKQMFKWKKIAFAWHSEFEQLKDRLHLAESCLENGGEEVYHQELTLLENKTND